MVFEMRASCAADCTTCVLRGSRTVVPPTLLRRSGWRGTSWRAPSPRLRWHLAACWRPTRERWRQSSCRCGPQTALAAIWHCRSVPLGVVSTSGSTPHQQRNTAQLVGISKLVSGNCWRRRRQVSADGCRQPWGLMILWGVHLWGTGGSRDVFHQSEFSLGSFQQGRFRLTSLSHGGVRPMQGPPSALNSHTRVSVYFRFLPLQLARELGKRLGTQGQEETWGFMP